MGAIVVLCASSVQSCGMNLGGNSAQSDGMAGGNSALDLSDPEILAKAKQDFEIVHGDFLESDDANGCEYGLAEITHYTTQVVSGEKLTLTYNIQDKNDDEACAAKTCTAQIHRQAWMTPPDTVLNVNCGAAEK